MNSSGDSTGVAAAESDPSLIEQPYDYSPVLGGPLFQIFRKAHLSGTGLELANRRVLFSALITWLPLAILYLLDRNRDDDVKITFFQDIETHVRFLIALPILIGAEILVHKRIKSLVSNFVSRQIVPAEQVGKFRAAIDWAARVRNLVSLEIGLVILVYTLGTYLWQKHFAVGAKSWYGSPGEHGIEFTLPGYWYAFVCIPVFQFILLRWYVRFFIWSCLLLRISRMNLRLIPGHPDRAGGLGFLGNGVFAFSPILFAQGVLLSGLLASRIFFDGANLMQFKAQIAGFIVFFVLIVIAPLVFFTPRLISERRRGMAEFGALSVRYLREFEAKWLADSSATGEPLLGSADLQSLADLGNSSSVVSEMRPLPLGLRDITQLVAVTILPILPLSLTVIPLEEIVDRVFAVLF